MFGSRKDRKKPTRSSTAQLFEQANSAAAVGGITVETPLSRYLLPPEVVLYEPSARDIRHCGKSAARLIFLNTPLTEAEQKALDSLHEAIADEAGAGKQNQEEAVEFPAYVRPHALRLLQQAKWDVKKAISLMHTCLEMRVRNLPVFEGDVVQGLKRSTLYWHGRDRSCRPVLVWRMSQTPSLGLEVERAKSMILWVLEFAIRHLMVPGRVETWVFIVDLRGCSFSTLTSSARSLIWNLRRLVEEVYCERNFCAKILYMPALLQPVVNFFVPEDKKHQVEVVRDRDISKVMTYLCQPHQLEQHYGGSAPNVKDGEAYPYRFFPHCCGPDTGGSSPEESVHGVTDREFHEGCLWDAFEKDQWVRRSRQQSLPFASAQALCELTGATMPEPCTTLAQWKASVAPKQETPCAEECGAETCQGEVEASPLPAHIKEKKEAAKRREEPTTSQNPNNSSAEFTSQQTWSDESHTLKTNATLLTTKTAHAISKEELGRLQSQVAVCQQAELPVPELEATVADGHFCSFFC
eukprot:TRINITY_DN12652_c0_g2_i1.p1 TRINITY_DN12652_c0_g2~~TRINITY_DN12652_c0_g2_i1.p1  ORF type:complete len:523 (-),score=102.13 TRINITY_DN12652_c0_g2_i1:267-1835(-)